MVLSVNIYWLELKAGHQAYMLWANYRVSEHVSCEWTRSSFLGLEGEAFCARGRAGLRASAWHPREGRVRGYLLGMRERRKSQSSVLRHLASSKDTLSLEAVDFQVARVPGTRSAIIPGVWMKSLLLCPGMGQVPSLCNKAAAALIISATVGKVLVVGAVVSVTQRLLMSLQTPLPPHCNGSHEAW